MTIARRGRRLDVLYVGTLPPHPGGSAIVGAQLVSGLARLGHAVRAIAPITGRTRARGDRFVRATAAVPITRFVVPYFESAPNNAAGRAYRAREGRLVRAALEERIAERRPDVVVIGRETFAWHVPDVSGRHRLPTIVLAHGATTAGMRSGSIPPAAARRLITQLARADVIVLVARHLEAVYRGWGLDRLRVVRNGVDLRRFRPRPKSAALRAALRIGRGDVVVLHASNLKDIKRPLDLVESAYLARRRDPRLVYVVVGDGPMRAEMMSLCRRRGLTRAFRFVPWVEHDEMPRLLNLADIVVMPSETEAMALLYLETMASGRVLLATDIPATREIVRDGHDAVLFPCGDVAALAARTMMLAARPQLRRAIGARAYTRARRFAVGAAVDAYAAILRGVVRRRRGAAGRSRAALRAAPSG